MFNLKTISNYIADIFRGREISVGKKKARWTKVKELKVGAKIAVTKSNTVSEWDNGNWRQKAGINAIGTGTVEFDEIVSIKKVGRERVYDIEVEGTRNFVGNGILAHNTFISGNLGIGTTTPTYRLQLPNVADATGQGQANAWPTYSSGRWKENVEPMQNALGQISQLNPVYFDWKKEYGGTHSLGFIAEEVGKVIPEVVTWEADGVNASGLDYAKLSTLAIAGIKELDQKLANLNLTNTGDLLIEQTSYSSLIAADSLADSRGFDLIGSGGQIVTRIGAFAETVSARIKAGIIQTTDLIAENAVIANFSSRLINSEKVISPTIETNYLSPVSGDLTIDLGKNIIASDSEAIPWEYSNSGGIASSSTTPRNDNGFGRLLVKGNAEFTGNVGIGATLQAEDIRANQLVIRENLSTKDASISGELVAESARIKKLRVESIEGLEAMFATMSAQFVGANHDSPAYVEPNISGLEDQVATSTTGTTSITGTTGSTGSTEATQSAELLTQAQTWPITDPSKDVKITGNIAVLGLTTLAQTIISGPLTQDGTFLVDNGNSINVLGGTLYLQNQRTGGIDLLAGKVSIDKDGNTVFEGDLTVKKTLFAGLIRPPDSGNIVFDLSNNVIARSSSDEAIPTGNEIASGSGALSPNLGFGKLLAKGVNGEVIYSLDASGSATYKGDLAAASFKITREAIAAEPDFTGTIESTASAGLAKILPGKTEVTIKTPFVTEKSLIYLTPIGSTKNQVLYLARINPEEKTFTPSIDNNTLDKELLFSWWVVN